MIIKKIVYLFIFFGVFSVFFIGFSGTGKTYVTKIDNTSNKMNYHTFKPEDEKAKEITKIFTKKISQKYYSYAPVASTFTPSIELRLENNDIKILLQNGNYLRFSPKYISTGHKFGSYTFPEYHKDGNLMGWVRCDTLDTISSTRRSFQCTEFRKIWRANESDEKSVYYFGEAKHVMFIDMKKWIRSWNTSLYIFSCNNDRENSRIYNMVLKSYAINNDVYTLEGEPNIIPVLQNIELEAYEDSVFTDMYYMFIKAPIELFVGVCMGLGT